MSRDALTKRLTAYQTQNKSTITIPTNELAALLAEAERGQRIESAAWAHLGAQGEGDPVVMAITRTALYGALKETTDG